MGDEKDQPIPVRLNEPFEKRKVSCISAAENHSLVSTVDGKVYAWGSNRFGQLGFAKNGSSTVRFVPRKVEDLKKFFVTKVACGLRHSVCLTGSGQVLTWGDNSAGQLGVHGSGGSGIHSVTYLWKAEPVKIAFQVSAGEQSTLVLTKPCIESSINNAIYEWGHGMNTPTKVIFPMSRSGINPISISSGRHHNVALTKCGKVFSWGFHSESLGTKHSHVPLTSRSMGRPRQVIALSSEVVVHVSASDDHTAVVTDTGSLYTFGASNKDVLGHTGVKFQQSPKKVVGVQRVISGK